MTSETPSPSPSPSPEPTPSPTPATPCPLTGLPASDPTLLGSTALLVQIENHPDGRPPRNLAAADLVIEAPVEGDVTRYSAVFLCNHAPDLTGPIRSARYYNVDLWQQLHVLTVGFGASSGAQARFRNAGMPYVNGLYGIWPWFERGQGFAPHNLYGDLEALRGAIGVNPALTDLAEQAGTLRPPFTFGSTANAGTGAPVHSVTLRTNSYWHFGFEWIPTVGLWQRIDGDTPLTDRSDGGLIQVRSVVVQVVDEDIVYGDPDPGGNARRDLHMVGQGTGYLYVDGQVVELHWARAVPDAVTTWTVAATGTALILERGMVWWEIVGTNAVITNN